MNQAIKLSSIALIMVFVFSSCSDKFAGGLQKRKHRSGFYLASKSKDASPSGAQPQVIKTQPNNPKKVKTVRDKQVPNMDIHRSDVGITDDRTLADRSTALGSLEMSPVQTVVEQSEPREIIGKSAKRKASDIGFIGLGLFVLGVGFGIYFSLYRMLIPQILCAVVAITGLIMMSLSEEETFVWLADFLSWFSFF